MKSPQEALRLLVERIKWVGHDWEILIHPSTWFVLSPLIKQFYPWLINKERVDVSEAYPADRITVRGQWAHKRMQILHERGVFLPTW